MTPNVALSVIALSLSGLLRLRVGKTAAILEIALAIFPVVIGVANLYEIVTGRETQIIGFAFSHRASEWDLPSPFGRSAPNSAGVLIILGVAAILSHVKRYPWIGQVLTTLSLLVAALAIIGYLYNAPRLYIMKISNYAMAPQTAVAFAALSLGFLFVWDKGWTAVLFESDIAGVVSRRLLFTMLLFVPLLGYIRLHMQVLEYVSTEVGTGLIVIAILIVFTLTILQSASVIRILDENQKVAAERLRQTEKLAAAGRLAAVLAHEVNNPLEAVTNIVYLLSQRTGLQPDERHLIAMAEHELARIAQITRRTLAFYRESSAPVPTDLSQLIREAVEVYESKFSARGITLRLDLREVPLVTVYPGEIQQVLSNLILNAIDACGSGGVVAIRDRSTRDWTSGQEAVSITVADSGPGITSSNQALIFQPFFTTKGNQGSGLGLWVSLGLVLKHQGRIRFCTCTGERNHGASFSILLPLQNEIEVVPPATQVRPHALT